MINGITESGFEFQLEDEALDDYELIEELRKVDKGDIACIVDVVDRLLGKEQKEKLKEHLRKENGRVSASGMFDEVTQIFNASKEIKN